MLFFEVNEKKLEKQRISGCVLHCEDGCLAGGIALLYVEGRKDTAIT
jgi:hypothetical protein